MKETESSWNWNSYKHILLSEFLPQAVPLVLLEPHSGHRMDKEDSGKSLLTQEMQLGNRIREEGLELELCGCVSAGQA